MSVQSLSNIAEFFVTLMANIIFVQKLAIPVQKFSDKVLHIIGQFISENSATVTVNIYVDFNSRRICVLFQQKKSRYVIEEPLLPVMVVTDAVDE